MPKVCIKSNSQCSINIPKELVEALGWENGDTILISKIPGQKNVVIENISKEKEAHGRER